MDKIVYTVDESIIKKLSGARQLNKILLTSVNKKTFKRYAFTRKKSFKHKVILTTALSISKARSNIVAELSLRGFTQWFCF